MAAISSSAISLPCGVGLRSSRTRSTGLVAFDGGRRPQVLVLTRPRVRVAYPRKPVTVRAEFSDGSRGGDGGDFFAGFLLGGTLFGTLAYIFAPQIRRYLLNEDEYGFWRAKQPNYYDEGLETTRQTLNDKISQLNSAIDTVSSRLRGNNAVPNSIKVDSEVESAL